jgi:hypothetical protein
LRTKKGRIPNAGVRTLRRNHANQISCPAIGGAFGGRNPDGVP